MNCATLGPAARSAVGGKSAPLLSADTQHAEFILSLSKGFECWSNKERPHAQRRSRFERKRKTRLKVLRQTQDKLRLVERRKKVAPKTPTRSKRSVLSAKEIRFERQVKEVARGRFVSREAASNRARHIRVFDPRLNQKAPSPPPALASPL